MRVISAGGTIDIPYEQSVMTVKENISNSRYTDNDIEIITVVGRELTEDQGIVYSIVAYCRNNTLLLGSYLSKKEAVTEMERLRAAYTCGRQIYQINSDIYEI